MADTARISALAHAVATEDGVWSTERVREHHRRAGFAAPNRRTARADLQHLARRGLLVEHADGGDTYYSRREARR